MARGFNSNYFIFFIESIKNGFIISTLIAFISIFIEGSAGDNSTFFILGYWFANIFWFAFFNIEFGNLCNILPLFIVFFVWVILNVRFLVLYQSR
jgi:hypothetical protein